MQKKTKILVGVLVGVVIGLCTGGVFYFLKKKKAIDSFLEEEFDFEEEYGKVSKQDCKCS